MSGAQFLAGLAQGVSSEVMSRAERKREEERQKKQMTASLLGGLLHDENLSPAEHGHVVRMLFDVAGMKGAEADRILGSYDSFREIVNGWMGGGQAAPAVQTSPTPEPFKPNRLTLESPQPSTTGVSGRPSPIPEVPGAPGANTALVGDKMPTPGELETLGREGEPAPRAPLRRPDNYYDLSPRVQRVIDQRIKDQQSVYDDDMREIGERLRIMGGTYRAGDARFDELVKKYGVAVKRAGAAGMNPQKIRSTADGKVLYFESLDTQPIVLYQAGMSEAEKQRNAVALASVNAYRSRNGEEPLMFAADLPTMPGTSTSAIPDVPGANKTEQPNSILVPVPGAKRPGRVGYGRQRGSARGSSSGSRGDSIGESLKVRDAARFQSEAAQARAQAAAARGRGDDPTAAAYDEAARVADENAQRLGGGQARQAVRKRGDPLGILD